MKGQQTDETMDATTATRILIKIAKKCLEDHQQGLLVAERLPGSDHAAFAERSRLEDHGLLHVAWRMARYLMNNPNDCRERSRKTEIFTKRQGHGRGESHGGKSWKATSNTTG